MRVLSILLGFVAVTLTGWGQAAQRREGTSRTVAEYYQVQQSADTVFYYYWETPWALQFHFGGALDYHVGKIAFPRQISTLSAQKLDFASGVGARYGGWIGGQWRAPSRRWGIQVMLGYQRYDVRLPSERQEKTRYYELHVQGQGGDIAVEACYYLIPQLPLTGGIGLQYHWEYAATLLPIYDTTALIVQEVPVDFRPQRFQVDLRLGVGYQKFLVDFVPRFRVYAVPRVEFRFGTPFNTQDGNAWYVPSVWLQLGLQLSVLQFRKEIHPYRRPTRGLTLSLATIEKEITPRFPAWIPRRIGAIAVLQEPIIAPPTAGGPPSAPDTTAVAEAPKVAQPRVEIKPNEVKRFHYPSPLAVQLTPEMRLWLDQAVRYLRTHPRAQIRIVGHTDNFGTALETQRVSEQRANVVRQYLIQRGINPARIFASGQGARFPIADNRTEAGRRLNRRVEIVIVE